MGSPGADEKAVGQSGRHFSSSQHPSPGPWPPPRRPPSQAPTLTLRPTPGMATMATVVTMVATVATTGPLAMATMERDLLMKVPLLPLAPTLMPLLIPGTDTTAMVTGHTAMVTMATGPTGTLTGVK